MPGRVSSSDEPWSGTGIGLTLRSVGSNNMLPLVLCLRQGWHAVCQRVRRVHQFLLWGMYLMVFFGFFGFFLVSCAYGESLFFGSPCYVQDLGYLGVPHTGHALLVEFGWGFTFVTSGKNT